MAGLHECKRAMRGEALEAKDAGKYLFFMVIRMFAGHVYFIASEFPEQGSHRPLVNQTSSRPEGTDCESRQTAKRRALGLPDRYTHSTTILVRLG